MKREILFILLVAPSPCHLHMAPSFPFETNVSFYEGSVQVVLCKPHSVLLFVNVLLLFVYLPRYYSVHVFVQRLKNKCLRS